MSVRAAALDSARFRSSIRGLGLVRYRGARVEWSSSSPRNSGIFLRVRSGVFSSVSSCNFLFNSLSSVSFSEELLFWLVSDILWIADLHAPTIELKMFRPREQSKGNNPCSQVDRSQSLPVKSVDGVDSPE